MSAPVPPPISVAPPPASDLESAPCPVCGDPTVAGPALTVEGQMGANGERFGVVRCATCGQAYLRPRPTAAGVARYYGPDYPPHRGAAAWGRHAPLVRRFEGALDAARLRVVRRAAPLGPGRTLLDFGCGHPTFLAHATAATGARGIGIDLSDAGWRQGDPRFAALDLRAGGLAALAAADRADVLTLWHVLEHDYAPVDTLAVLRAHAAPGAVLVVEVPDAASLTCRLQGRWWAGFDPPRHTLMFEPATLRATLARAGWTVTRLVRRGTLDPYVLWWLGEQARRGEPLTGNLERLFWPFVAGRVALAPLLLLGRVLPLGAMLAVARAAR